MGNKIAVSMLNKDMEGFTKALDFYKEEGDFSASLYLAQEFSSSGESEYYEFIELLVGLRPNLLTVYHNDYGQPLFRQIFKNGSEKTLDMFYLDKKKRVVNAELLKKLLLDARQYHEEALDGLQELYEISFSLYGTPVKDQNGDLNAVFTEYAQDDPRDIIRHLNTVVRQRRMLRKLEGIFNG